MAGKIVLHIGAHKTATTFIQELFFESTEALQERGIRYEPLPRDIRKGLVSSFAAGKSVRGRIIDDLVSSLNPTAAENVVFCSWEGFMGPPFVDGKLYGRYRECSKLLTSVLSRVACEAGQVIFYVRRQDHFLASAYIQSVKEGSSLVFDEFLDQIDKRSLAWTDMVENLKSIGFPVTVVPYEEIHSSSDHFLAPILERVGIERSALREDPGVVNSSYSTKALAVARAVNGTAELEPNEIRQLRRYIEKLFISDVKPSLVTPALQSLLAPYLLESNVRLAVSHHFRPEIKRFYSFEAGSLSEIDNSGTGPKVHKE